MTTNTHIARRRRIRAVLEMSDLEVEAYIKALVTSPTRRAAETILRADAGLIPAMPESTDRFTARMNRRPIAEDDNEIFERLAEEFRRETGLMAPGKDRAAAEGPGAITDRELMDTWRSWLKARKTDP